MQVIMTAYTMYVNKKYSRVGHIFQGRFKSIIIQKETYFLQVLRYIHLNPLKARLIDNLAQYPWSSYHTYLSEIAQTVKIEKNNVLERFSPDKNRQKRLFIDFTLAGLKDDFEPEKAQIRGILGDGRFRQKLTKVFGGVRP